MGKKPQKMQLFYDSLTAKYQLKVHHDASAKDLQYNSRFSKVIDIYSFPKINAFDFLRKDSGCLPNYYVRRLTF